MQSASPVHRSTMPPVKRLLAVVSTVAISTPNPVGRCTCSSEKTRGLVRAKHAIESLHKMYADNREQTKSARGVMMRERADLVDQSMCVPQGSHCHIVAGETRKKTQLPKNKRGTTCMRRRARTPPRVEPATEIILHALALELRRAHGCTQTGRRNHHERRRG